MDSPASSTTPQNNAQSRYGRTAAVRRPKISQACEECRARKVRCDGAKPTCGACRRRRTPHPPCVYPVERASGVSARYVAQLEKRVRDLEGTSKEDNSATSPTPPAQPRRSTLQPCQHLEACAQDNDSFMSQSVSELSPKALINTKGMIASPVSTSNPAVQDQLHIPFSTQEEGVDGMGNFGATETSFHVASSSAAGFMNQIKSAIAAKFSSSQHQARISVPSRDLPDPWADPRATLLNRSTVELFALPSRREADEMIEAYWEQIHILYPFLLPDRFMASYQRLWTGEHGNSADIPIFCILNLIFALVCHVTMRDAPQEKALAADVFYRRAALLLQTSVIGRCSLELVQALLLMGQYLQGTEWPRRGWVVVGHAIRIAQGLGLHLPETTDCQQQQDRELMRRIWHGCVFLDRMVSMTLGRPVIISRADALAVPLPAEIDDIYLSSILSVDGRQPAGTTSRVSFMVNSLKLFDILEKILAEMYSPDSSMNKSGPSAVEKLLDMDFNFILRTEASLQAFHDSLPRELLAGPDAPGSPDPILFRQARVLHLRYLHVKILLFRPVLSLLLAPEIRSRTLTQMGSPIHGWLPVAMALPCARDCVHCALEVIYIIHQRQNWAYDKTIEPLPAWWYEVFFIYTAATALIPARIYSYIRGDIPQSELQTGWQRSLEVLQHLSPLSPSAVSCIAALQVLNDELVFEGSGTKSKGSANVPNPTYQVLNSIPEAPTPLSEPAVGVIPPQTNLLEDQRPPLPEDIESMLQIQDFSWLDTLPVDVLAGDYADIPDFWQETW